MGQGSRTELEGIVLRRRTIESTAHEFADLSVRKGAALGKRHQEEGSGKEHAFISAGMIFGSKQMQSGIARLIELVIGRAD